MMGDAWTPSAVGLWMSVAYLSMSFLRGHLSEMHYKLIFPLTSIVMMLILFASFTNPLDDPSYHIVIGPIMPSAVAPENGAYMLEDKVTQWLNSTSDCRVHGDPTYFEYHRPTGDETWGRQVVLCNCD
jgi:hypothetical protein